MKNNNYSDAFFLIYETCFMSGISTTFGRACVNGISVGTRYSLKDSGNPFAMSNVNDKDVKLKLQPIRPENLISGYEAIPNLSWVELEKTLFDIESGGRHETDIIITIPNNKIHQSKNYQIDILCQSIGNTDAPMMTTLLIKIGGPAQTVKKQSLKRMGTKPTTKPKKASFFNWQ